MAGLSIGSSIKLPGLAACEPSTAADITILRRTTPESLVEPLARGPTWQFAADQFLLTVPGIARIHLSSNDTIAVTPDPRADAADIPAFLIGSVIPILLHLHGLITLRASAVGVDGKAVLFCGASGAGKSTLAAALARRGHMLLADDICTLAIDADARATVYGDGGGLKLWAQAIERLQLTPHRGAPLREKIQKFHVSPPARTADALPLGAIYAIREARPPYAPGIERRNIVDAALLLRRSAYHPRLIEPLAQRPLYLHAAALGNHAGVYTFTRRIGFDELPAALDTLEAHWRTTGGLERAA